MAIKSGIFVVWEKPTPIQPRLRVCTKRGGEVIEESTRNDGDITVSSQGQPLFPVVIT